MENLDQMLLWPEIRLLNSPDTTTDQFLSTAGALRFLFKMLVDHITWLLHITWLRN